MVVGIRLRYTPDVRDRICAQLPEDIRIHDIQPVMKSFDARTACGSRIYRYVLPTAVFAQGFERLADKQLLAVLRADDEAERYIPQLLRAEAVCASAAAAAGDETASVTVDPRAVATYMFKRHEEAVLASGKSTADVPFVFKPWWVDPQTYRADEDRLKTFRSTLRSFEGTHSFHNFTSGRHFSDAATQRHIKSFTAKEPFVYRGVEFILTEVHGASFMRHHIRKMIGCAVAVAHGSLPQEALDMAFDRNYRIPLPRAPGLGLYLFETVFERYNARLRSISKQQQNFTAAPHRIRWYSGGGSGCVC